MFGEGACVSFAVEFKVGQGGQSTAFEGEVVVESEAETFLLV